MNKEEKSILERHWKKIIVFIYAVLLISGGAIGYYMSLAPSRDIIDEENVKNDEVGVWVNNELNETRNLTVRMYGDSPSQHPDSDIELNLNITSFETKEVEGYEEVLFKTEPPSTYNNYPFDIEVYEDGDLEEPVAKKSVRLTVGHSRGNENEFYISVP